MFNVPFLVQINHGPFLSSMLSIFPHLAAYLKFHGIISIYIYYLFWVRTPIIVIKFT